MRIDVTQEDIDKGERAQCRRCPVALAVRRALGNRGFVEAGYSIVIDGERFLSPNEVCGFVSAFDGKKPVAPFSFELPIDHLCGADK